MPGATPRCTTRSRRPHAALRGRAAAAPRRQRAAVRVALPHAATALAGALMLQRAASPCRAAARARARSTGASRRRCSSAREAAAAGRLAGPRVLRLLRRGRLRSGACATPAGARSTCPARWRSTTSSSRPARARAAHRRVVAQPRPLHAQAPLRRRGRGACAGSPPWTYALRALAALVLPRHDPRRYWRHVIATLRPARGEGLREAAESHNRSLAAHAGAGGKPA